MFDRNRKVSNHVSNFIPRPITLTNSCINFDKYMQWLLKYVYEKWTFPSRPKFPAQTNFWQTHVILLLQIHVTTLPNTCNYCYKYMKEKWTFPSRLEFPALIDSWGSHSPETKSCQEVWPIISILLKFSKSSHFFWSCRYYSIFLKSPKIIPYFFKSCQNNLQKEQGLTHNRRLSTDLVTTKKRPGRIS